MFPLLNRREILRLGGAALAALFAVRHSVRDESAGTSKGQRRRDQQSAPDDISTLSWAGDATQNSVEVSAYTTGTTSVGLAVSLSPDMAGATYLSSAAPNEVGWNKWSVPDLSPASQYYHQLTDTLPDQDPQLVGDISSFWTLRPGGVACTSRIAVGCCEHNEAPATYAFDDIVAWSPDRFVHIGDLGYPDDLSTDPHSHMNNWSLSCGHPGVRAVQTIACMDYVASDHDTNGSGQSNRPNYRDPITAANIVAWQQVVPARMEDTRSPRQGRFRADVEGNVRFVKLDTRSLGKTNTMAHRIDPHWKQSSMLGSTQLGWLKKQIDTAVEQHQLIVLFSDCAWNGTSPGPPIPASFSDKWPSYIYERDLVSDYAAGAGAELFIVYGDSHGLQQDDGTNEKNGFASIGVGPLDSPLHMHYQDANQWSYPDGIVEGGGPYRGAQHYQRLTITQEDGSSTITVTADARDCSLETGGPQTVRTMAKTYNV